MKHLRQTSGAMGLILMLGLVGCSSTTSTEPTPAATSSDATTSAPDTPAPTPTPTAGDSSASEPRKITLKVGQTAQLAHFKVTAMEMKSDDNGQNFGVRVRTCYTKAHKDQNPDGTTRVSTDPWSLSVRDGEGSRDWEFYPVSKFPASTTWKPQFQQAQLKVGECTTGWIAIKHDNPDLQFHGVRYAPKDFGDVVTWTRD